MANKNLTIKNLFKIKTIPSLWFKIFSSHQVKNRDKKIGIFVFLDFLLRSVLANRLCFYFVIKILLISFIGLIVSLAISEAIFIRGNIVTCLPKFFLSN